MTDRFVIFARRDDAVGMFVSRERPGETFQWRRQEWRVTSCRKGRATDPDPAVMDGADEELG